MKKTLLYTLTCVIGLLGTGCQKKLIESPQSTLTPDFFKTTQGFQAGLDAAYAGFRTIYGPDTYFEMSVAGTDEFQAGIDGTSSLVRYNSGYLSTDGNVSNVWSNCYTFINTCNGLIDNSSSLTGMPSATVNEMVAEAKFLRANYYFILVQQWGDVTLNKKFQAEPTTSATRSPAADVYDFIVQDLKDAIASLPATPLTNGVAPGKATKTAAMHVLAKVYLTRGTSTAKKTDDFQNAYNTATDLISNVAPAGGVKLLQDFGAVYAEGNEANSEVLWSIQHTPSLAYNGSPKQDNRSPDNLYNHLFVPRYEKENGMQRDIFYGRPYARVMPTHWLTDTVFKERVNDQRYNKTFQTMWRANYAGNIPKDAGGKPLFTIGDTAVWMPGYEMAAAQIAKYRYEVIPPSKYSNALFPALIKYFDTKRTDANAPSIRPIIIYRLAETYLIAAEAAFRLGDLANAVKYINIIRERAAYPTGSAAAMDIKASDLSIDFILDERSRELCGELMRWNDLVRTGTLVQRVKQHNVDARPNIQAKHTLRPIPQGQIDATITGTPYPQNPGW